MRCCCRYLECEEAGEELLFVPDHHGIGHNGQLMFDAILNGNRGNLLSTGRDDQLLLAARDKKKPLLCVCVCVCDNSIALAPARNVVP